jgi:hypothetical protein
MKQLERPLSDDEIDWLARMLLMFAEIPSERRIALTAMACKIGFINNDDHRYETVRREVGL